MMKFDLVSLEDVFKDVVENIEAHKKEIAEAAGDKDLNFDYPVYEAVAQTGQMLVVTLRHDERLVGYSVFHLSPDLRNRKRIEATNHGVFVEKAYRKKYGLRMLTEEPVKFLTRVGVTKISFINDSEVFGRLMKRFGFGAKQTIWSFENGQ